MSDATSMSATERLRQLLDERGVEWYEPPTKPNKTWFPDSNGINCSARPWSDKLEIKRHGLTPEQAVEATLGRGTCHIDYHFGEWYCTGCGNMVGTRDPDSELHIDGNAIESWSFCPNCGRKVEQ